VSRNTLNDYIFYILKMFFTIYMAIGPYTKFVDFNIAIEVGD